MSTDSSTAHVELQQTYSPTWQSVRRSSHPRKQTKRLVDDLLVLDQLEHVCQGKAERDNKFYDIEIDHKNKKMKLHFKSYSTRHDEWRRDLEDTSTRNFPVVMLKKLEKSSKETLGECSRKLHTTLYLEIKRKLHSVRREHP